MAKVKDTLIIEDNMTQALKNVQSAMEKTQTATQRASKSLEHIKNTSKKSTGAMIALGSAVGTFAGNMAMSIGEKLKNSIGQAIGTASALVEVQNVVDNVFENNANAIDKWSKSALTNYGLNELSAKKFTGTLGAMMKSSGIAGDKLVDMSTKLAGLAGDMASFYDLDPSEAFAKIRSGISGESEPLKQIGIDLTEASLKADLLALGFSKNLNQLSQSEKIMVRYHSLLRQTVFAQGDNIETALTFANQQRKLSQNWAEMGAAIAKYALPALTKIFIVSNKALEYTIKKLPDIIQGVQVAGILVSTAIGMITPYLIALKWNAITTFVTMKAQAISTALSMAAAWAVANAPILIAIALVGAVSVALKAMGISFTEQAQNIVTSFLMIGKVVQNIGIFIANMFRSIYNGVINTINVIRKLKGESPLEKKEYTQFKSVYADSAAQTKELFGKAGKFVQDIKLKMPDSAVDSLIQNGALKTKQQGAIELKDEDIQTLNELASRDFMVRYQQLSPSVTFGNVTVNENADFSNVLGQLDGWVADKTNNSLNVGVGE